MDDQAAEKLTSPRRSVNGYRGGLRAGWSPATIWVMLAKLKTFSLVGIDALAVEVEVDVSPAGLPKTVIVGPFVTYPG